MKQLLVPDLLDSEVHFSVFAVRVQTKRRRAASGRVLSPFAFFPQKTFRSEIDAQELEDRRPAAVLDSLAASGADRGREFDISANYRLL